jgi:hypothetical protein
LRWCARFAATFVGIVAIAWDVPLAARLTLLVIALSIAEIIGLNRGDA